jgi:hypothetical protein
VEAPTNNDSSSDVRVGIGLGTLSDFRVAIALACIMNSVRSFSGYFFEGYDAIEQTGGRRAGAFLCWAGPSLYGLTAERYG